MNKGIDMNTIIFDVVVRIDLPEGWQEVSENVAVNTALKRLLDLTGLRPVHYSSRINWSTEGFSVKFHWRHDPEGISYAEMEKIVNELILKDKRLEAVNREINAKMEEYTQQKIDQLFDKDPDSDENGDDINGWASASSRKLPLV